MQVRYQLMKSVEQTVSVWSGGTTTQLAIFPPDAVYSERSFLWRISTATVTAPASTFTALSGFHRHLMVLAGEMQLFHAGHHQVKLGRFEQDSFSGSWATECQGVGRDFNLMLAAGWQGRVQPVQLSDRESVWCGESQAGEATAFYCLSGLCRFSQSDLGEVTLGSGDFLLLPADSSQVISWLITAEAPLELIHASVWPE